MSRFVLATLPMLIAVCTALASAAPGENAPSQMSIPNLPPHPRLLLNKQGIEEMKARIAGYDWSKTRWDAIQKAADKAVGEPVVLPPRGANWFHWYACPVHGCSLNTGKQIGDWQWEHKCPVGGELVKSDPTKPSTDFDGCVLQRIHDKWSRAVLDLGLAYQVTGDKRYADKAREILLAYSEKYLNYPLHTTKGEAKAGGGRVGSQNLDESVWLIPICQGADLIWEALDKKDQDTIARKLLIPAAKEVIQPAPHGIHNIQNWRNSAIGLVGFLVDEKELIRYAIDNPDTGFRSQMLKGVTADGQWWEGAWGYHFYTMSAIWGLTEAARNCGIDLYVPQYKKMFDAPLRFMMPNMRLPAFNDSGEVGLSGGIGLYELAYARYKDPMCLDLLSKDSRANDYALWYGVPTLPGAPSQEPKSTNYTRSGYAILTKGKGADATWLCMKYGPHGGGHGHPDKLSFVLYSKGHVLGLDPGTCRYGLPIRMDWYVTTLAHNTLTVDSQSQKPAEGRPIAFGSDGGIDYAVCDAGPIAGGVRFVRTAALVDENLVVFVDQISSDTQHTYDITYHEPGDWTDLPSGDPWAVPDSRGYKCLANATTRTTDAGLTLTAKAADDLTAAIGLAPGPKTEIITATGVGANVADRVPVLIYRRSARSTAFVWYVSLTGKPVQLRHVPIIDDSSKALEPATGCAVAMTQADGRERIVVANPEKRRVRIPLADGSELRTQAPFAAK